MPKTPDTGPSGPSEQNAARPQATTGSAADTPSTPRSAGAGRNISERKGQFLIAPRKLPGFVPMGLQPLQFAAVENNLRSNPDIEIVDTVGPKNIVGMFADGMGEPPSVLVARMTEEKAANLYQQAQGRLIIERDQALVMHDTTTMQPMFVGGMSISAGPVLAAAFTVLGKDNAPVKDAEVYLFGSMLPATGVTNERGEVTLSLYGETPQSVRSLYVKPKCDYWSFYQAQPEITPDEANVIGLRALSDWPGLAAFPQQQTLGWGQKAMRLDQLPGNYRGQGIRIAVIDSGAATTHDDLKKIRFGFDVINKKTNPNGWADDTISHGSHCAGTIAGVDNAFGIRGFAPEAEVHVCKLFPGGQVSQLIDALEYCIEKQIDVANLSLGGIEPSEALEQQIQRAKRAGVACIVAAGNSGERVQYPGSSPNVLAVAAIGKLNEFPPDSYHTQTLTQMVDTNGYFAARFSCYGPEVGVCAPGVAITSSVPSNNFAVWDGTSMAAPHITGLAALVLAHHPDFRSAFKLRGPERVERLFQVIRASARPVNVGDPSRTGFGMPDVMVAVGLQTHAGVPIAVAGQETTGAPAGGARGMSGGALGGAIGAISPQQAGFFAYGAPYTDQAQLSPQWLTANSWPSPSSLSMASIDPYAAYFGRQPMNPFMSSMGFGMGPGGYSRQGW